MCQSFFNQVSINSMPVTQQLQRQCSGTSPRMFSFNDENQEKRVGRLHAYVTTPYDDMQSLEARLE